VLTSVYFIYGESLERNNIRAHRHKCKIKPELLRVPRESRFRETNRARANRPRARPTEKTYRGPLSARRIRETAPAYPHFLDNKQIARRPDPHLTVWFPAIDRLDRLITRHVAPSIETEVIDHGAHFWSTIKNTFPSSLRCNLIDVNNAKGIRSWRIGKSETYLCPVQRVWKIPSRRDEQISAFGDFPRSLKQKIVHIRLE